MPPTRLTREMANCTCRGSGTQVTSSKQPSFSLNQGLTYNTIESMHSTSEGLRGTWHHVPTFQLSILSLTIELMSQFSCSTKTVHGDCISHSHTAGSTNFNPKQSSRKTNFVSISPGMLHKAVIFEIITKATCLGQLATSARTARLVMAAFGAAISLVTDWPGPGGVHRGYLITAIQGG